MSLAHNTSLPQTFMYVLADDIPEVQENLAAHPNLPEDLMWKLSGYERPTKGEAPGSDSLHTDAIPLIHEVRSPDRMPIIQNRFI